MTVMAFDLDGTCLDDNDLSPVCMVYAYMENRKILPHKRGEIAFLPKFANKASSNIVPSI